MYTICYVSVCLGASVVAEALGGVVACKAVSVFLVIATIAQMAGIFYCVLFQVIHLMNRTATIQQIVTIYFVTTVFYALVYFLFENIYPLTFQGIDSRKYPSFLRKYILFFAFLYSSNVCQTSTGLGDTYPTALIEKLIVATQCFASVIEVTILLQNWIS